MKLSKTQRQFRLPNRLSKNSLSLWERAGVRGAASERGIERSAILRYPLDPHPNPLPKGEGTELLQQLPGFLIALLAGFFLVTTTARLFAQSATDASLNAVRASDRLDRAKTGKFQPEITAAEHMRRASVYTTNRQFAAAREHWQAVLDNYPSDASVPAAIYGMARSYYQGRRYADARQMYERRGRDYPETKEGRDELNVYASSM